MNNENRASLYVNRAERRRVLNVIRNFPGSSARIIQVLAAIDRPVDNIIRELLNDRCIAQHSSTGWASSKTFVFVSDVPIRSKLVWTR